MVTSCMNIIVIIFRQWVVWKRRLFNIKSNEKDKNKINTINLHLYIEVPKISATIKYYNSLD